MQINSPNRRVLATLLPSTALLLTTACASWTPGSHIPSANSWPQFRGPAAQGLSTATNLPTAWSPTSNVVWKSPIPGAGWSSPVLHDNQIILSTAIQTGDQVTLHLLKLKAEDGQLLWDKQLFQPDPTLTESVHKKNSLSSSTPIISDGIVYAHFGHLGTAAVDFDSGNILWKTHIPYQPVHGNGGSPVLVNGLLVFSADGANDPFVIALDAATGDVKWKTPRPTNATKTFSFSTPLVINSNSRTEIISAGSGMVGSFDPDDGHILWKVTYGEGYSIVPRPLYAHGHLYVTTGFNRANLLAIRLDGAEGDLTESNITWQTSRSVPLTPSPLVIGQEIYFLSDNGILSCADALSGEIHWSERVEGNYSASPVAGEGKIYLFDEQGSGTVIEASPKALSIIQRNELEEPTLASPALLDNALVVRTKNHLWRIGSAHSTPLTTASTQPHSARTWRRAGREAWPPSPVARR